MTRSGVYRAGLSPKRRVKEMKPSWVRQLGSSQRPADLDVSRAELLIGLSDSFWLTLKSDIRTAIDDLKQAHSQRIDVEDGGTRMIVSVSTATLYPAAKLSELVDVDRLVVLTFSLANESSLAGLEHYVEL